MDRRKFLTLMGAAPIAAGAAAAGIPAASAITTLGGVNLGGLAFSNDGWDLMASDSNIWTHSIKWDVLEENPLISGMDGIEDAMDSVTDQVFTFAKSAVKGMNYGVSKIQHLSELPIKPWVKMADSYADKAIKAVDGAQKLAEDTIEAIEDHHGGENDSGSNPEIEISDDENNRRSLGDSAKRAA